MCWRWRAATTRRSPITISSASKFRSPARARLPGHLSVPLKAIFKDLDLALGTYRHTVGGLLPEMTKAAWAAKKDEIQRARPGITRE